MKNILFAVFFWTALGLAGAFGQMAIAAEDQQPGAPQSLLEEASLLLTKSSQLASAGLRAEAVEAAQAAVGMLRGFVSPPDGQTAYLWLFTQALDAWTVRLIEAGRLDEAARAAHETVQVARQAAAAPGADVNSIASLMMALSRELASAGLHAEGGEMAQAAADVVREEGARRKAWEASMSQTPLPKTGCFTSAYPNTGWQEVPCVKGPENPN
jgi:hypothetical protein